MPYKETYAHAFVTAQKSSVTALETRDIPLGETKTYLGASSKTNFKKDES